MKLQASLDNVALSNEILRRQMEVFAVTMREDWSMMLDTYKDIQATEMDAVKIIRLLSRQLNGSEGYAHLLQCLQLLLLIRPEPDVQKAYLRLISTTVSQIVLDGKGIDPDFS